jgi:hypothetical protein
MSELDTLIIKLLETLITKYKLVELNRYEEAYDYVMLEISLMNDIHHLMLGTYIFNEIGLRGHGARVGRLPRTLEGLGSGDREPPSAL